MTSIEWLFDRFNMLFMFQEGIPDELQEAFEQAKEMHKQEIIDACNKSIKTCGMRHIFPNYSEKYYQETFKKD
jgi:hypothetical protein